MYKKFFKGKKILILGGTGSIGSQILKTLIGYSPRLIRIFSRDEYKQHKLRYRYADKKNVDYVLGDVADLDTLTHACENIDVIFHCAALKHVPISEEMPEAFIKTNILGSLNVKKAAMTNKVPITVSISSDKAVDPTNLMGLTKSIQEKIFSSHFLKEKIPGIKFISVRFGNVIGTTGSLFPIIYHQIINKKPITITHPEMTRFYMSKKGAIELIFWATLQGKDGEIIIKKMKSAKIMNIVKNFLSVLKRKPNWPLKYIGIRVGEKLHESLITEDNLYRTYEKEGYYIVKPYNTEDIIVDKMIDKNVTVEERKKFFSFYPSNFLNDKETAKYIKDFIYETNQQNEII